MAHPLTSLGKIRKAMIYEQREGLKYQDPIIIFYFNEEDYFTQTFDAFLLRGRYSKSDIFLSDVFQWLFKDESEKVRSAAIGKLISTRDLTQAFDFIVGEYEARQGEAYLSFKK